jgi:N-acetylglucosamine kinase-like BadF-type ATPase
MVRGMKLGERLLAVDGGGASTEAWLTDRGGNVLGRGEAGPSNAKAVGLEVARSNLHRAITEAFSSAGSTHDPADLACFGLAGFDRPDDQDVINGWSECTRWTRKVILVNDGDMVLAAGTPEGYGVGLIAATGSIAVGRTRQGATARAGGWGHLMGDEGSGYAVALAGLRRVARLADGRETLLSGPDVLTGRICEALGMSEPSGLVSTIYSPSFDRSRIAALAPVVVAAGEDDPAIRDEILIPAGQELARSVAAVIQALGGFRDHGGLIPLAVSGGFLLGARVVMQSLLDQLERWGYRVEPSVVPDPVRGALVLARRALDGQDGTPIQLAPQEEGDSL